MLWWHKVAPGFHFTILDLLAEGDKVIVHWKANANYSVVLDPPPTNPMPLLGKPVQFRGMDLYRFEDGKTISLETVNEWMNMMVDAGVYVLAAPEKA